MQTYKLKRQWQYQKAIAMTIEKNGSKFKLNFAIDIVIVIDIDF